jgi:LemA protein
MNPIIIIAGIVLLIIIFFVSVYNRLSKLRILVQEGWSGIGAFLQQRRDLIPNLVEVVKGYAGPDTKTLTDVLRARNESLTALTRSSD